MSYLLDGYTIVSSEEFIRFIKGGMKDDKHLKSFYNEWVLNTLSAKNLKVEGAIEFYLEDIIDYEIHLHDCIFQDEIKFHNGEFNILSFTSCKFHKEIKINNGYFNKWLF